MSAYRRELLLWLLSLTVLSAVASTLHNPGSLDACYHFHVAQNLAAGRGMVEDLIWNYLDKSAVALALPHPSHLYWMPLTAWIAWLGILCFGRWLEAFTAAQVPFVLLASLIPLLAYRMALRLWGEPKHALLAGLLCLLAPSYLQAWVVPEPVTPYCLSAALAFWACMRASAGCAWCWPLAGAAIGLAHLTRADGALLLLSAAFCAMRPGRESGCARTRALSLFAVGYLSVVTPWFARNFSLVGAPLPLSVSRTAWLHRYDEIFSYATELTAARWFSAEALGLLRERAEAALKVLFEFLGMFQWVVPPLLVVGFRRLAPADQERLAPCVTYAVLLLLSMMLVFPHPAQYGTLFRGASALLPWAMAIIPGGLEEAARRYGRMRRHPEALAQAGFRVGLVTVMALVTLLFHVHRLRGILPFPDRLWNRQLDHYVEVEAFLRSQGASGPVLVFDPPGFTLATGRPSIVVPSDGARAVTAAADRFGARWLILEANVPSLNAAWRLKQRLPGFTHVRQFQDEMGSPVQLLVRTPSAPCSAAPSQATGSAVALDIASATCAFAASDVATMPTRRRSSNQAW